MTDPQTPATDAGRRLVDTLVGLSFYRPTADEVVIAIEAEARAAFINNLAASYAKGRADALREAAERVRALGSWTDAVAGEAVDRAAEPAGLDDGMRRDIETLLEEINVVIGQDEDPDWLKPFAAKVRARLAREEGT